MSETKVESMAESIEKMNKKNEEHIRKQEEQYRRNQAFPRRIFVDKWGKLHKFLVYFLALFSVIGGIGVIIAGCMWLTEVSCHSRWKSAGVEVSWGPLQ